MSVNVIRLIPTKSDYVPHASLQRRAADVLKSLLPNHYFDQTDVTARVTEHVEFIDQGGNFERILCPFCSTEMPLEWWHQAMDNAYKTYFEDLRVLTPCCHTNCSLNDLHYEWPAGFARFTLEAVEPYTLGPGGEIQLLDLNEGTLNMLEGILKCRLRIIWAHY